MSPKVSDATARLQVRQQERRRGIAARIGAWSAAVLLLAGLAYLIGFSEVFATQKVAVTGVKVLTRQQVIAAAAVGLGTPLARVDTGAVADRVAGLAPVAEVTVTRLWPDTIQIDVVERRARLAIAAGSSYLIADATGVVFQTVDALPSGLVLVSAPAGNRDLLTDVGAVYSALSADIAAKVEQVEAPTRDNIQLRLRGGARVVWGSAENSALKNQVLEDLLAKGGRVFDVSAPGFPTRR